MQESEDLIEKELRNTEERYFYYFLQELKEKGFIYNIEYEKYTFKLSSKVTYRVIKTLKTKVKKIDKSLLQPHVYTPDFIFDIKEQNTIIKDIFTVVNTEVDKIFIDVKGKFARNLSTSVTFPLNQKWVYSLYEIYVEKKIPFDLFEKTFTPKKVIKEEVYKTSKINKWEKGDSKLKYNVKTIEEYIKQFKNEKKNID